MHHSAHGEHARHDLQLIAGHAAGDLSNLDTAAAAELLAHCTDCAEIHRDLVAISVATRALPRTASAPRDFQISAEQADRLQRGSWLRTLLRPFASARSSTRPMAAAFTSLGVVGLLVATIVPGLLGGAASAPARDGGFGAGGASTQAPAYAPEAAGPTNAPQAAPGVVAASADSVDVKQAEDSGMSVALGGQTGSTTSTGGEGNAADDGNGRLTEASSSLNPLMLGSLGLLALGLALFGLRFAARRLR
jgi:hypothetical protein